ncbi:putative quinol monooxygenase [Amorphus coralli]|uniref:putative quinol monooxygenase n=1 Tax=Amorphus coralli TaxID=340680 RepID=UPI000366440C|nr:antibiotic biosynthesis monooxygenase [Amorphus coralli]
MSVTYAIRFAVRPEHRARFERLLGGVLDRMRHEASFVDAALHANPDDACDVLLVETWQSHEDVLAVQLGRDYRSEWHAALEEILEKPREVSMWQRSRLDRAADQEAQAVPASS